MKARLVQDSYTGKYTIERWNTTTSYNSDGTYAIHGDWTFIWPYMHGDVKGMYTREEKELAEREFDHYVNTLNAIKIVHREVEI